MKTHQIITEDEAALYDRQIRLWGVDAQKKLLASRILMINMNSLAAEIAKNLVLSGINSLTLLDSNDVSAEDIRENFLLFQSAIGKNRAESSINELVRLNPMVKIVADRRKLEEIDSSYFNNSNFDLVCALIEDNDQLKRINHLCRNNSVLFMCGVVTGMFGYMFVDFNEFHYIAETVKIAEESSVKKTENDEKQLFQEKTLKFKSYTEFLEDYHKPIEGLTFNKMKRLSKNYFLNLIFNQFYLINRTNYDSRNSEDLAKLLELKKSLFEKYEIDERILPDSYIKDKKFEKNYFTVSVNAILGGTMGQEIIKAISKKNKPTENFFLFDAELMNGEIMKI